MSPASSRNTDASADRASGTYLVRCISSLGSQLLGFIGDEGTKPETPGLSTPSGVERDRSLGVYGIRVTVNATSSKPYIGRTLRSVALPPAVAGPIQLSAGLRGLEQGASLEITYRELCWLLDGWMGVGAAARTPAVTVSADATEFRIRD